MSKYLAISLILVALIIGIGTGYYFTPQYSLGSEESMEDGLGTAGRTLDLRYLNAMIAHHRGAIALAEQVKNESKRSEIRTLAEEILTNEPKLIDELYTWKKDWYKDRSKVKDKEWPQLGTYDEKLDLRFLNALIAHHEEGVHMAQDAQKKSTRNDVLTNAFTVDSFLSDSIVQLKDWRFTWYEVKL
jgi:hypothetical protein